MEIGEKIFVRRDLSFPTKVLFSGLTQMDHGEQRVEFVRNLGNGELVVRVRGHEFVVGENEVVK